MDRCGFESEVQGAMGKCQVVGVQGGEEEGGGEETVPRETVAVGLR